jgi:ribosomal protein L40E
MKVTCIKCGKEGVSMGKYFDDNFKDKPEEYVCLRCNAKEK